MCSGNTVDTVDTTGAGDCFIAGFLATRSRGYSLARAELFANAVGALNVQCIGAVEGVLSEEGVLAWMQKHHGNMADVEQPFQ